ncbi:MAG: PGPGW domain-containing protein [Thermodesulfovibrionales bacterium]
MIKTFKQAKRIIKIIIGFTILISGLAMIILPGPAILIIPAGLAILATEFIWARKLLEKFKNRSTNLK